MKNPNPFCFLSTASALALCSSLAAAQTVAVSVDATAAGAPLQRVWAFHGFDEINYSTLPDGLTLLKALGQLDKTPPYIRSHFYLNSGNGTPSLKWGSTNVYSLDGAGAPVYDWTLVDGVTDALTSSATLPFVELGFMPQALSTHPTPYMNSSVTALDGGCFYPPTDYVKWRNLISTLVAHQGMRYPNAASSWLWELWNEPELGYWHGTAAEYFKLFDYTEAGFHQSLPTAALAGPASYNPTSGFLQQFLQHCATGVNAVSGAAGTRIDMVTFHAKGGTAVVGGNVEMNMGHQLSLHRTGFSIVASFPQFKQTPIVVSEGDPDGCAACVTPADTYRRVPAYGAYEIEMMKRSLDLEAQLGVNLRGVLAWAFMFPNTPYFQDLRVLSTQGVPLAVLNAFKLIGNLDGMRLPVTSSGALTLDAIVANSVRGLPDIDAMATFDGQEIKVLVWNYHDDITAAAPSPIALAIKVPSSFGRSVTLTHLRMDDAHGNPYGTWVSQGSPAAPSTAQVVQLQAQAAALTLQPPQVVGVVGGQITVDFSLPRFGVSLLTLSPVVDGGGANAAVDASTPDASVPSAPVADGSLGDASVGERDAALPGDALASGTGDGPNMVTGASGAAGASGAGGAGATAGGVPDASAALDAAPSHAAAGCSCRLAGSSSACAKPPSELAPAWAGLAIVATLARRRKRREG